MLLFCIIISMIRIVWKHRRIEKKERRGKFSKLYLPVKLVVVVFNVLSKTL